MAFWFSGMLLSGTISSCKGEPSMGKVMGSRTSLVRIPCLAFGVARALYMPCETYWDVAALVLAPVDDKAKSLVELASFSGAQDT